MKNKKVKVTLIIVFIIALIIISLFVINEIMKTNGSTFKAIILKGPKLSTNGNPYIIVGEYSNCINGTMPFEGDYSVTISEQTSITKKGKEIDVSELGEGDVISVTYMDESLFTVSPCPLYDVKKIKLLEKGK